MKINLCTISFRHELVSFDDLIEFASRRGFDGIELWSVHAESIARSAPLQGARTVREMKRRGLEVPMISGYVKLLAEEEAEFDEALLEWDRLIALARLFETDKIRLFAGSIASSQAEEKDWDRAAARLRLLADEADCYGIRTVIETHPGTLADSLATTLRLIQSASHPGLGVNLDFLHLWEAGDSLPEAYRTLRPWTVHCHCKNVIGRSDLSVFQPDNVYAPGGRRAGMASLQEGAVDYAAIMTMLARDEASPPLSLEWFGGSPFRHVVSELAWIRSLIGPGSASVAQSSRLRLLR